VSDREPTHRDAPLADWYAAHGRHALPWRADRDRWSVLVSEVMLHQTQVARVEAAWRGFIARFPEPAAMAAAGPGAVITAWGRLGYPRRARRLWEAAVHVTRHGWPDDLTELPGVGRYTAGAVRCQADGADVAAVDVNIRRVIERVEGRALTEREAETASVRTGRPLTGRDRLLALMDLGALVCRPGEPACSGCPLRRRCATRGALPHEAARPRQGTFAGSFRQRRGEVMARLRAGPAPADQLDRAALASLVADGLAEHAGTTARLPRA
jgi:A/G-specific adenine glycosylase